MTATKSKKIWSFVRLIRPEITLLGIVCVYIGAVFSGSPYFSVDLLLGMISVFFIGAGCHPFNDYFDYEIDKIVHPNRPLASRIFPPTFGFYIGILFFLIGVITSAIINIYCLIITLIGIVLIFLYELWLKNKALIGNVSVAFSVALSFTYGGAIVGNPWKPIFFTLISFFIFLGREILMDVRDFEGDRQVRMTLPFKIGKKQSVYIASIIVWISLFLLFLPYFWQMFSIWYVLFALPVALVAVYAISLSFIDLNNVGKTTEILRICMILGLILFIGAIFM